MPKNYPRDGIFNRASQSLKILILFRILQSNGIYETIREQKRRSATVGFSIYNNYGNWRKRLAQNIFAFTKKKKKMEIIALTIKCHVVSQAVECILFKHCTVHFQIYL